MDFTSFMNSLHDPELDSWIAPTSSDIDSVAYVLNVDPHYLSAQVRLHLPYYSRQEIADRTPTAIVREILHRLRARLDSFAALQQTHRELNGSTLVSPTSTLSARGGELTAARSDVSTATVIFDNVPQAFGESIQRGIHYIHKIRSDTEYHLGLRFSDHVAPFCYAAFSSLDRSYLRVALSQALGSIFEESDRVAVMTRAYGYSPTPKNSMSKLFNLSAGTLRSAGYSWVITALNPFLGFRGSIFSGSSYTPFATSPMRYTYSLNGDYSTRRAETEAHVCQRFTTPPIAWLVSPLTRRLSRRVDSAPIRVYTISDNEYARG